MSKELLNIRECSAFAEPDTWQQIENWIDKHTGLEALHITTACMMLQNLIVKKALAGELLVDGREVKLKKVK